MKSNKVTRKFPVEYQFTWQYGEKLSKIKSDIVELEKRGVTHIYMDAYKEYGDMYISVNAYAHRMETDEEYNRRILFERSEENKIKNEELALLAKLKAKYA